MTKSLAIDTITRDSIWKIKLLSIAGGAPDILNTWLSDSPIYEQKIRR